MKTPHRGRPLSFDRAAVLDAAIRLFWRNGYEATSVRELSDALNIGLPSLYNTFGNKQELYAEALEAYASSYGEFIANALREEPTARRAIARILREAPERYTRSDLPPGCLIISGDSLTADPQVAACAIQQRRETVDAIRERIAADIAFGVLPEDTDAYTVARYTMAVMSGLAQAARDGVPRKTLRDIAELALRTLESDW